MATFPPPWESGPGPADPAISASKGTYVGNGYGPIGQGTVGVGTPIVNQPAGPPAQARMYVQGNQLIILDNQTGNSYAVPLATALAQPPVYSPTHSS